MRHMRQCAIFKQANQAKWGADLQSLFCNDNAGTQRDKKRIKGEREMKIEINFTPPESCNICKWAKYKNHQFKHCCLIFDKQIPDYRTGGRLEECKERANEKNKD